MMMLAFVLSALTWADEVEVWHVIVLAVALAAANAVDVQARQAFIVEMVEGKEDLSNAISLNSAIFNSARAVGPALASIAVATTGEAGACFFNGLTFMAVIASLLLMRLPPQPRAVRRSRLGSHLSEAARYVRSQQVVMVLFSLVAVSAFLSMPYSALMPVFASEVLKESAQPLLDSVCNGLGASFLFFNLTGRTLSAILWSVAGQTTDQYSGRADEQLVCTAAAGGLCRRSTGDRHP